MNERHFSRQSVRAITSGETDRMNNTNESKNP